MRQKARAPTFLLVKTTHTNRSKRNLKGYGDRKQSRTLKRRNI